MSNGAGMHPALQRRIREREHLLDIARGYARRLAERVPPRWVVVAGSVARGDFHDGSDVDVLVVSDALPPQPLRRTEVWSSTPRGFRCKRCVLGWGSTMLTTPDDCCPGI